LPQTPEEIKHLKDYALSKELYRDRLVSKDSRITLIVCRVIPDVNRAEVARNIKAITEKKEGNAKFYYSGVPVQISDLQEYHIKGCYKACTYSFTGNYSYFIP